MTYRDEDAETSPLLAAMRERWPEGAEVRDVVIPPLDAEDTKGLALALLDSTNELAERMARAVAREARGSPFLVEELVRGNSGRMAAPEGTLAIQTLDSHAIRAVALAMGPVDVLLGASSHARQLFLALRGRARAGPYGGPPVARALGARSPWNRRHADLLFSRNSCTIGRGVIGRIKSTALLTIPTPATTLA